MSGATIPSRSPDDRRATLALSLVADVGPVAHQQLLERFRSAPRALDGAFSAAVARDAYAEADACLALGASRGLTLVVRSDALYPPQLEHLSDPPPVLWSRGDWATLSDPIVAIVGTRRATAYGKRVTREIAAPLARAGACVVSGMALGIDACAHRAALDAGGRTVAVLGTGADIAYPRAHTSLHREIAERGLVLSELSPGSHSGAGSFPRRNRIIAALARLTIVVEAPMRSGALLTSRDAGDLGRDVAAVPGPIDSPQSEGTNQLIRDGAHAITSAADALSLVGLEPPVRREPVLVNDDERRICAALRDGAASLDELCARAGLPVGRCLSAVSALELRAVVECALTGEVRLRR